MGWFARNRLLKALDFWILFIKEKYYIKDKYVTSQQIIKNRYDSLRVPYNGLDNDDYAGETSFCNSCRAGSSQKLSANSQRLGNNENAELLQYYYHPDHLGSSSFITDLDGNVAQHVEYVPFGEVFLEEHNNTWQTPYLFNDKELDEETGLYYYGAGYYDPKVSLFISHDPLAEFTGTPYQYCYQNPINLTDPTGMSAGGPPDRKSRGADDYYYDSENDIQYYGSQNGVWGHSDSNGELFMTKYSDKPFHSQNSKQSNTITKSCIDGCHPKVQQGNSSGLSFNFSIQGNSPQEFYSIKGVGGRNWYIGGSENLIPGDTVSELDLSLLAGINRDPKNLAQAYANLWDIFGNLSSDNPDPYHRGYIYFLYPDIKKKDYKQKYSHIYPAAFYDSIEFYGDYEQQYKFEMLIYNRFLVEPISSKDDLKYYPNVKYKSFNFTIEEDAK